MALPQRKTNRLQSYDYSAPGAYFLTICTQYRKKLFWSNARAACATAREVPLSPCGMLVEQSIQRIPCHYPAITVDHYVIMPNHIHLLLQIHSDLDGRPMVAPTVMTVVKQMKGYVSKQYGSGIWQKEFHDHVVRNDADYREIWRYIEGNPGKWAEDKLYTP